MTNTIDWVSELRSVLGHWHNTAYLENHWLADRMWGQMDDPDLSRAQALRRMLRLAIESLQPPVALPPRSPEARPVEILYRHYIGRQSMIQIGSDLDICEREAYRELRCAMEALVRIVQHKCGHPNAEAQVSGDAKVRDEVNRLAAAKSEEIDLVQLLADVSASAQQLARERGITIELLAEVPDLRVAINRVMLRQAMLNLLSHLVRNHQGNELRVHVWMAEDSACVRFVFRPLSAVDSCAMDQPYTVAAHLLDSLRVQWSIGTGDDGNAEVNARIPLVHRQVVLLVDDNEGLTALFTRYLQKSPFTVYSANSSQAALEMIAGLCPDVVVIDVMMPEHDGWELMEKLRTTAPGQRARLVICSIINDPELASALGADAFLHKPVNRARLLGTIKRVLASPAPQSLVTTIP